MILPGFVIKRKVVHDVKILTGHTGRFFFIVLLPSLLLFFTIL